jgi:hypothetical protein
LTFLRTFIDLYPDNVPFAEARTGRLSVAMRGSPWNEPIEKGARPEGPTLLFSEDVQKVKINSTSDLPRVNNPGNVPLVRDREQS